jgi:6-pyruvoyltetrahydropterin/6-carboxytetrahydropterin synthase
MSLICPETLFVWESDFWAIKSAVFRQFPYRVSTSHLRLFAIIPPMYEVCVKTDVKAAHQLRYSDGKYERLHGHNWLVEVVMENETLDSIGVIIDFALLQKKIEEVLAPFDHARINHVKPFDEVNPSAENFAKYIHDKLMAMDEIKSAGHIKRVTVGEDENILASFIPE